VQQQQLLQQGSRDDWDIDGSERRKKVKNNNSSGGGRTKARGKRGGGGKGKGGGRSKGRDNGKGNKGRAEVGVGVGSDKISIEEWGEDVLGEDVIGLLGTTWANSGKFDERIKGACPHPAKQKPPNAALCSCRFLSLIAASNSPKQGEGRKGGGNGPLPGGDDLDVPNETPQFFKSDSEERR
jgi:hypothetical protein